MNKRMRSLTLTAAGAIALLSSAAPAHAQGGGTDAFKWYVGGHAGVLSFRTAQEGRDLIPAAGGHMLITAKRTGLLLSVDQAFGDDELTSGGFQVVDRTGAVIESGTVGYTFQGIRKYSAVLLAYPIRNRTVQPFVGIGGGLLHTTTMRGGFYADGGAESELGSSGFGTGVAGLEFRVGPLAAFGMWQVTTKSGFKQLSRDLTTTTTRHDFGEVLQGATHTIAGGLRLSLGSARETFSGNND